MNSANAVSTDDDSVWIQSLRETIAGSVPGWTWAELNVIEALKELDSRLRDSRSQNKKNKPDWESLTDEVRASLQRIPLRLLAEAKPEVDDLNAHLISLVPPKDQRTIEAAKGMVKNLQDALLSPSGISAAWEELVAAHKTSEADYEELWWIKQLLETLCRESKREWPQLARILASVLADDAIAIVSAKVLLGDLGPKDVPSGIGHEDTGGTDTDERLGLCQRLLTLHGRSERCIVWLAFHPGDARDMKFTVGPNVTFHEGRWVRAVLDAGEGSPNYNSLPAELINPENLLPVRLPSEPERYLLARIDLGSVETSEALHMARFNLEAIVAIAQFKLGITFWNPMEGYLMFFDQRLVSESTFAIADEARMSVFADDAIKDQIASLEPTLGAKIPLKNPTLEALIDAIHWVRSARHSSGVERVMPSVRGIEVVTALAGDASWYEHLKRLRSAWAVKQALAVLRDAVWNLFYPRTLTPDSRAKPPELESVESELLDKSRGHPRVDLQTAMAFLRQLAAIYPPLSHESRALNSLSERFDSGPDFVVWLAHLEEDFDRLLSRLRRVRNAVTHGWALNERVIETVVGFGTGLAAWSLDCALEAVLAGGEVSKAFEVVERRYADIRRTVESNDPQWRTRLV